MKKYSLYIYGCIIVLAALFLSGCNNEETLIENDIPQVEKGKVSFILPFGSGGPVTYANPVTGLDEEYKLSNLRIFWFDGNGLLYKRFGCGDGTFAGGIAESVDGDSLTAQQNQHSTVVTFTVNGYDGDAYFYIVANVNGSDTVHQNMVSSDPLNEIRINVHTRADFEKMLTDALNKDGSTKLLGTPLLMSVVDDAAQGTAGGCIALTLDHTAPQGQAVPVTLKRRVARFDIINTARYTNFEIRKIYVSRAQNKGYLHDRPFDETGAWADENLCKFEIKADPTARDSVAFNGPKGPGDDFHLTEAAFYLYPTIIKGDNSKTEIILEGIYNGDTPKMYTIDLTNPKYVNNEINIEANKVYRINVVPASEKKMTFTLEVVDWEKKDSITSSKIGDKMTWGVIKSSADPTKNDSIEKNATTPTLPNSYVYEFTTSLTSPDTIIVTTQGTNLTDLATEGDPDKQHTSTVEINLRYGVTGGYLASDLAILKAAGDNPVSTTTLTYGTVYTTTHKIALPPTDAPIDAQLEIKNIMNPLDSKIINIRSNNYAKTGYKPVMFTYNDGTSHTILWAPLNVGAQVIDKTASFTNDASLQKYMGNQYQWGRNVAFVSYGSVPLTTTKTALDQAGADTITDFIQRNGASDDWLTPSNDNLWQDPASQPTPQGWRMATKAEFDALILVTRGNINGTNYRYFTTNAAGALSGDTLFFPNYCYRDYGGTLRNARPTDYWTSTKGQSTGKSYYMNLQYTSGSSTMNEGVTEIGRAYGFAIRAVRDITTNP
jgi:uncharacterized protein (TIGR02145 family)